MSLLSFRKEPKMTTAPTERREPQDLDTRPRITPNPAVAAAMVSAQAMLDLQAENHSLKGELSATIAERETWRARAEAKQELLDGLAVELNRYRGFAHRMTQGFNDASGILVKIMEEARNLDDHFRSQEQAGGRPDDGQASPGFLHDSHLQEDSSHDK